MDTDFAPRWPSASTSASTSASDQACLRSDKLRVTGLVRQPWQRRVELPIGGVAVPALDRVSTLLVAGHDQLGALAGDRRQNHTSITSSRCFDVSLLEAPPGRRGGGFLSILGGIRAV
jgi:hypothetical protein